MPEVGKELIIKGMPLLTDLMLTTHLLGMKPVPQNKILQLASFDANVFDKTISSYKKSLNVNIDKLQKQYSTRALRILNDVSKKVEKDLRNTTFGLIEEGATLSEATETLRERFQALGIDNTKDYQLETIFRTQSSLAYGAGRWIADQDPDIQEILWGYEYSTVGDDRVREEHAILDGTILPKDDPFWQRFWPPNGWNCRCIAIPIFADEVDQVDAPEFTDTGEPIAPDEDFDFNPGEIFDGAVELSYKFVHGWSLAFDPDQPRDAHGQWTSTGADLSHVDRIKLFKEKLPGFTGTNLTKLAAINHRAGPGKLHIPIALNKGKHLEAIKKAFPDKKIVAVNALAFMKLNPQGSGAQQQVKGKVVDVEAKIKADFAKWEKENAAKKQGEDISAKFKKWEKQNAAKNLDLNKKVNFKNKSSNKNNIMEEGSKDKTGHVKKTFELTKATNQQEKEAEQWQSSMPHSHKQVVNGWTSAGYDSIQHGEYDALKGPPESTGGGYHEQSIKLAKEFNEALDKAPKFEGTVYRGLKIPTSSKFYEPYTTVGAEIEFKTSQSCSRSPVKAAGFSAGNIMLRIKMKTGAWIEDISNFKYEKEVVARKDTKYRVLSIEKKVKVVEPSAGKDNARHVHTYIDVEEI